MTQLQIPATAAGETYIGAVGDKNGNVTHVILLPGDNPEATRQAQIDWAASIGGFLPTRVEQVLLQMVAADQFQLAWYWGADADASQSDRAWAHNFFGGAQGSADTSAAYRARAVRRVAA